MKLLPLLSIIFFVSCAKVGYVTEQAIGQVSLEWDGVENEKVLMDPKVSDTHKKKIQDIQKYKTFFYEYFKRETTDIYDETTFLKQKAVTYLVIASSKKEISPLKTSFPFVGEFPYLGFFKKKSAQQYKEKLDGDGYATYMRPVYAYSTLNQLFFDDNILSSFFYYGDQRLAELIFHELTHTIFFAKNEVDFNESFAEYIGRKLSYEYFKYSPVELQKWERKVETDAKMMSLIAKMSNTLNQKYSREPNLDPNGILKAFIAKEFKPATKQLCAKLKIKKCWPATQEWNNAKFAAFMTYTKEQNLIETIHNKYSFSLSDLLKHIEKMYAKYDDSDSDGDVKTFAEYLKRKELF